VNVTEQDFFSFRSWIKLNLEGITWQGRFTEDFEDFWQSFFVGDISLGEVGERFRYARTHLKIGPLTSWFDWLEEKFLCFIFINKNISIVELSRESKFELKRLATVLRNYYVDIFPHLEEQINEIFQIANSIAPSVQYDFEEIKKVLQLESDFPRGFDDDLMCSLEVTLYEDWRTFLAKFKNEFLGNYSNLNVIETKNKLKYSFKLLGEAFVVVAVCFFIILGVKYLNEKYAQVLLDQISIYEPKLDWLNREKVFKARTVDRRQDFQLNLEDLENLEDDKNFVVSDAETRFETESDVTLISWNSLPKDFDVADLEESDYEEHLRKGYRESRYGNTKVYRVIMKTVDSITTKKKLNELILKYKATQVDHVKPGQEVPGGMYYNLYVPREFLKEFIEQVKSVDSSISYESRTRAKRNPPGKNKVFIWVKKY